MSRVNVLRIALCVAVGSTIGQTVRAELITPKTVTSLTAPDYWLASNLIDNSGLSVANSLDATHAETTPTNAWVTNQSGGQNSSDYYAAGQPPVLTFGLGGLYNIDSIAIWNYSPRLDAPATAKNCTKFITLAFGVDGVFGNDVPLPTPLIKGYAGEKAQVLSFGRAYLANTVRMTITDNWYDGIGTAGGGDRVGLSEVKFLAPEPSSLLLTGSGLLGLVCLIFARLHAYNSSGRN